jgi:hypothetical protein
MSTLNTYNLKSPDSANTNLALDASGNVAIQAGSASAPSIYVTGDANTGIYSPGADQVAISTNGTGRLFIDSSGRVGLGTSSPSWLLSLRKDSSSGGAGDYPVVQINNADANGYAALYLNDSTAQAGLETRRTTGHLGMYAGGSERGRWDSSGRFLVGTSTSRTVDSVQSVLQIESGFNPYAGARIASFFNDVWGPSIQLSHSRSNTTGSNTLVQNGDRLGSILFFGADGTNYITAASIRGDVDGTPGANDMPGRLVFSTTADGASSPTERMRIKSDGTVCIGTTNSTPVGSNVVGFSFNSGNICNASNDGNIALAVNRKTNDGDLVQFYQDGTNEGSISVSGTTISYNGAHLSRWSQIVGVDPYDQTERPEILRGTVMSNLDEMCDWTCPVSGDCQDNEQLNKTEISSVDDDPNVAGVFQSWDDDGDTWVNDFYLAMTGDFVIRIAAGTTIKRGDLLCSAGDGTARPQGDRYIKDSTIAKVTSTTVSCTHPDGSYCVPCVLMAC